jgi:hypothetical protein
MATQLDAIDTIYLLYDGSSADGRGIPNYIGWTSNKDEAAAHSSKCRANPYCTGYVSVVTKNSISRFPTI